MKIKVILSVANSKRGGAAVGAHFPQKAAYFCVKGLYISLCAFAINEDGADKLSSAPFFKNFWSATDVCLNLHLRCGRELSQKVGKH